MKEFSIYLVGNRKVLKGLVSSQRFNGKYTLGGEHSGCSVEDGLEERGAIGKKPVWKVKVLI